MLFRSSLLGLQAVDDDGNLSSGKGATASAKKLPWLNRGTTNYSKVVKAIKSENYTIEDVLKKYQISTEVQKELNEL